MKNKYHKAAFVSLISLSIPTILEEILSTLLQYVDTAMVGRLGEIHRQASGELLDFQSTAEEVDLYSRGVSQIPPSGSAERY